MRYFRLTLFVLCAGIMSAKAQTTVALDSVWKYYAYRPASPAEFTALHAGDYYAAKVSDNPARENYIIRYSFKTGKPVDTMLKASALNLPDSFHAMRDFDFQVGSDDSHLLLSFNRTGIYRRSSKSHVGWYDMKTKQSLPVGDGKIQNAVLSPDGRYVAYMQNNNVFVWDSHNHLVSQVTRDGMKNHIINGACDWVYEEEFEFVDAIKWNANGTQLAFYRFDESGVPEYQLTYYRNGLYPEYYPYKYPKVGAANSVVTIWTYDMTTGTAKQCPLNGYEYVPRIKWTLDPDMLCILTMNRKQNNLHYNLYNIVTGQSKDILQQSTVTWIEMNDDLRFYNNNQNFILTQSTDGWRHIYNYDISGKLINKVTDGNYDVTEVYGMDEKTKTLFYQSAEQSPLQRQVYSINVNSKNKKLLTPETGWNDAEFNPACTYFLSTHSTANTVPTYKLCNAKGEMLRVLEDNTALQNKLAALKLSDKEFFDFKTKDNTTLHGWMIKPPHFDAQKKYPVLMHVYGGPGSQEVKDEFDLFWMLTWQYLAQHGYIIACVDNRGTGARGDDFMTCTYKKLGVIETEDQIEAAHYLGTLPYIDKDRIGMQGWSYGGFMACRCITTGADAFKAAVAIAPVTDWRFYDNIYTERFMQTPADNPDGYRMSSPVNYAALMKGNFLIMHGSGDDNVHYQNFVSMINALYKYEKTFTQFTFPDKNHGIGGGNTRYYLMKQMCDWVEKNL